jgi:hypothetical protein
MSDLAFLLLVVALSAFTWGLVVLCDRLGRQQS